MKGLLLCAGRGSRLRPLTFSRPKHLLPVMNKPVLFYGIESMVRAGIADIAVVVPPGYRKSFDEALRGGAPWNIKITLVEQPEPLGLADAVRVAEDYVGGDDFLLYLGDNVIDGPLSPLIERFRLERLEGLVSVSPVDRPEQFGVVQLDGDRLVRVVEKPKHPPSNLAINGVYLFRASIFRAIAGLRPSARGEYELTDAIQKLVEDGRQVGVFRSPYWWKDTGQPKDLILCNQHFLRRLEGLRVKGDIDARSNVTSPVVVGENTVIIDSVIRGPVVIGRGCRIENSYIGPYTAIADHAVVRGSEVENSIVMEHAVLDNVPTRIDESLIGADARVIGQSQPPKRARLWVGDHSQMHLPR
ncbi:glucose-1-phosphate thymidylyltransferase [Paenibacillus sp.]|uniref:glucose-1-phosphate thymidylyltransferase n=1 Tax=Paenibacillus sp. TaxID=58172 RepID=UPI002D645974|nr:glucose-1-phosphate thymidylyltransferase [Paenibacillus sp.]HZG87125.1 glucose-1-phosphate thymidylyltransferase [Paenibacillus sp.]